MTDTELLDILAAHFALVMDIPCAKDWHPVAPDVMARVTQPYRGRPKLHAVVQRGGVGHDVVMAWRTPRNGGSAYPHVVSTELKHGRPTKHALFRQWLPYGKWTCADGREVLFSRGYTPIWERIPGSQTRRADLEEWVPWNRQEHFYHDGNPPQYDKKTLAHCLAVLKEFGATWEPLEGFTDVQRLTTDHPTSTQE